MKKIKLLLTSAAVLVGGGIALASSNHNIINAGAATVGDSKFTYSLVTDVSNFEDGGTFIFAYGNGNLSSSGEQTGKLSFMGSNTGNYYSSVSLDSALLLTINPTDDNHYYIAFDDEFVSYNSTKNEAHSQSTLDNKAKWDFEYANEAWKIANIGTSGRYLQYNSSSPRFACYQLSSEQQNFKIYELESIVDTKFNVDFYYGEQILDSLQVSEGETIDFSLINTDKEDYVFNGWFTDPNFDTPFNEDTPITEDLNLYAKYTPVEKMTKGEIFAAEETKSSLLAGYNMVSKQISADIFDTVSTGDEWKFGDVVIQKLKGTNLSKGTKNNTDVILFTNNSNFKVSSKYYISYVEYVSLENDGHIFGEDRINLTDADFENPTAQEGIIDVNGYSFDIEVTQGKQLWVSKFIVHYETNDMNISSASIRFGATLDKETMYDENAKYGVIAGLNLEDTDLASQVGESTTVEAFATANKLSYVDITDKVAFVNEENATEADPNGSMFQFALAITDMLNNLDEVITAACYMEYEGALYVMKEATYSVRTLAHAYLDQELVTDETSIAVLNSIIRYQA